MSRDIANSSLTLNQSSSTSTSNSINPNSNTTITRAILVGENDNKTFTNLTATNEGHLEVAIHDPLLPFGSVHVENLTPIFQEDAVYGLFGDANRYNSSGSGTVTASDSTFVVSTGTTISSLADLQSRKRLRYRPGQGVVSRFTGVFSPPVNNSYQVIGLGHANDGVYFGYKNLDFGILYVNRGVRETRTLTITNASSLAQDALITLNDVTFSYAMTANANIQRTVYELSTKTYAGWSVVPVGSTLVFLANSAGPRTGTYVISGSAIVGSFSRTIAGVAANETFVEQKNWNGDPLNGFGRSGITVDWTKGNVFQIGMQYLGFGCISFFVEVAPINANNPTWLNVHTLKFPNTLTAPSFRNPSFPFTMAVYSTGSTTNLTLKSASYAGFIEGIKQFHGNRYTFNVNKPTVGITTIPLFTIYNGLIFGGTANQSVVYLMSISAAVKHTQPVVVYIIKNAVLVGNPNFAQYAPESCTYLDTTATGVTFNNNQLIWSGHLAEASNFMFDFRSMLEEIAVQPGEYITIAAVSVSATSTFVNVSINTREDQ